MVALFQTRLPCLRIGARSIPRAPHRRFRFDLAFVPLRAAQSFPSFDASSQGDERIEGKVVHDASHSLPGVLLVEDNADDAELSMLVLTKSGIAPGVKWVRDGAEAMEWLATRDAKPLKLILLDLKMPRMDGYEVLRRIKQAPATKSIPVIVMVSAHGTPELTRCFELGADSYLVKPLDAGALRDAVHSLGLRFA